MFENPFPNESYKSLEALKAESSERLDAILYKPLTVENIESFADTALDETTELIEELLSEYQRNPSIGGDLSLDTQQQEDAVCETLGLPNIPQLLDRIQEVKNNIDSIKLYLEDAVESSDEVITPPDQLENAGILPGEKAFEKKKLIPRLLTLMYVLNTDFGLDITDRENVQIVEGEVTDTMMRKHPYMRVTVQNLDRAVYVCDEEGNASYVFDTEKLQELNIPLDDLDIDGKRDKNSLIGMYQGVGVRVVQTPRWRNRMSTYLGEDLPEQRISVKTDDEYVDEHTGEDIRMSEFEKKEWLDFDAFSAEVKSLYPGEASVQKWYNVERQQHRNWPSSPGRVYKDNGWIGWSELVGKENRLKKEYPDFDTFSAKAKGLYPGKGEVQKWYNVERQHHKNWPSNPGMVYKDKGWIGWPELVGVENRLKKEYPDFDTLSAEVKELYPGEGSVKKWYRSEYQHHKNWPSKPHQVYKDKGWIGWSELVGK